MRKPDHLTEDQHALPPSYTTTIRVPREVWAKMKREAERREQSAGAFIRYAVRAELVRAGLLD